MNFLTGEDLGNLVVRVGLDGTELDKGLKNVSQRLNVAKSEMRQSASSFGTLGSATDKLRSQQEGLSKVYELQGTRVLQLRGQYDDLVKAHGAESEAALRAGAKLNNAISTYNNLGHEIEGVSKELAYQESAWSTASESLENFSNKAQAVGGGMQEVGKGLTAGITAPIAALAGASSVAAIEFESSFAGVRKTVDATEEEFASFKNEIREMAKTIPSGTTEINNVAEAAGQLGIKNENIMGFTRTMIDLGVATNMTSNQAAEDLARLANVTQMPQENFDRLGASIVDLGNNFATTESDITQMALRLAGAGAQIGLSEADILGVATALSSVGIQAEMGGSAVSRVMVRMQVAASTGMEKVQEMVQRTGMSLRNLQLMASNNSKDFKDLAGSMGMTNTELNNIVKAGVDLENFAAVAGMSAADFKKAFEDDAVGAIGSFINGLGNAEEAGESAINMLQEMGVTEIRLRDSLLRMGNANELLADSVSIANNAWEENVALTDEAEERYRTTESQLVIFWNRLKDVAVTLGDVLLPIMNEAMDRAVPFIDYIGGLAEKFGDLDTNTQLVILAVAGIVAAIGPVLVIAGTLVKSVGAIAGAFATATAAMGRWRTSATLTKASMTTLGTTATVTGTKMTAANTAIGRTGTGMRGLRGAGLAGATGLLMFSDGIGQSAGLALMFLPELAKLGKGIGTVTTRAAKGAAGFLGFGKDAAKAGGAAAKTGGQVAGLAGKAAGATKNIGLLAKGVGVARVGLSAFGGPVGWAITGISLLAEGGYHLYKHMKEELVPGLEDFGEGVSEATTEAVLGYKKLNDEATSELNQLLWSGAEVTDEISESLTSKFATMGQTITDNLKEEFDESKGNLDSFLKDSKVITQKEQDEIYKNLEGNLKQRTEVTENAYNDINKIIEAAANENREITAAEQEEINYLQDVMMKQAVRTMSEGEKEQLIIMGRLKEESGNITAQQAAETVRNSVSAKDGAIAEANKKYEEVKAIIEFERDVTGSISAEQADGLIAEHRRMKDEAIWNAENMHKGVVSEAQKQAEGHIDAVNWETGEILNRWDKYIGDQATMMNGLSLGINKILKAFGINKEIPYWYPNGRKDQGSQQRKSTPGKSKAAGNTGHSMLSYEDGTSITGHPLDSWAVTSEAGPELIHDPKRGTYLSGDQGPELTYLHKGSSVLPAHHTKSLLQSYGFPAYEKGIGDYFDLAMQGPKALIDSVWSAVKPESINGIGGTFVDMAKGVANTLKDGAVEFMTGLMPQISFGGPNFPQPPYRMSSPYGYRTDPVYGGRAFHAGIDYAAAMGTPIPSQSAGRVNFAGWMGGYGNLVKVKSGVLEHMYGHNSRNLVKPGDNVTVGQTIGLIGSTGKSTGPHVHYEVRRNGKPIDPNGLGAGAAGLFDSATGKVKGWLNKAIDVTGVPRSWLGPLNTIAQKESGGNPNAVNNWDSNARRGTPSRGLMQTIAPTFNAHKGAGMNNINDPVHNTVAAINYIKSRYGDISNVPGIKSMMNGGAYRGYAIGDRITEPQIAAFAENGWPEYAITTEPTYRARSLGLYEQLGTELGIQEMEPQTTSIQNNGFSSAGEQKLISLLQKVLSRNPVINPAPINIDGRELTEMIFDYIDEMLDQKLSLDKFSI